MNPQTLSKPVMDVSAPRPMQQPPAAADAIAVQPAPATNTTTGQPKVTPVAPAAKQEVQQKAPVPHKPSGAPVGVITVTVLVMMVLSAAAVIVYVTSSTT